MVQPSRIDCIKTKVLGIGEQPLKTPVKDHKNSAAYKSSYEIELEQRSGPCMPTGKGIGCLITNEPNAPEKVGSISNEEMAGQLIDHSRQRLEKTLGQTDQTIEESRRCDKGDVKNATLFESGDQNKDGENQTSDDGHQTKDNPALRRRHRDSPTDAIDENGAKQTTEPSRSTIGRVIMIDGIKFVAVTCLQPPKGHCRTCNGFGSLLYFSARSCYTLEAAEKFCSVQCARTFINETRSRLTPSRQPSGDVGSNVSVPRSDVRKNQRGHKDAGDVIEARNAKGRNIIKSKRVSRNVETLKNIYVDSLVTSTIDRSRNHRKEAHKRDPKRGGTDGSLTPPLPGQLAKTDRKIISRSETSVVERTVKIDDRELMSTTSDTKMLNPVCQREEMKSAPKERFKGPKKILQETRLSERGESSTSPKIDGKKKEREDFVKGQRKKLSFTPISSSVWKRNDLSSMVRTIGSNGRQGEKSQSIPSSRGKSAIESCKLQQGHLHRGPTKMSDEKESRATSHDSNKPLRNLTKGSLSRSKTKLWKKYGRKFQSRSCEFHQLDTTKVSRECDTPEPTSQGLVRANTKGDAKRSVDTALSLNQFHERRRSLFKTVFPFQDTLVSRAAPGLKKSVEDCGDVSTPAIHTPTPGSPSTKSCVSKMGSTVKTRRGQSGCKTSQRGLCIDKQNVDRPNSKWANLFQFMIEAADLEELERKKESNDSDKYSVAKNAVKDRTETPSMARRESRLSRDTTSEEVRTLDNQNSKEKRKKKKKKKKKKKRKIKKEKSLRQNNALEFGMTLDFDKKRPETPTSGRRKGKDNNRKSKHESDSPGSPGSKEDPDAWPKWKGDGKKRMNVMSSIDLLIWTMKNRFQPNIGGSSSSRVNGNLSTKFDSS
ncbi:uncharacterized protein LOC105445817 [Strongylocentrotus purpuratus]|uniref:Uncharacterized protein n=1 Tax=Strongylocentrotus purpuratus TaxID=7668 RepID=A0A7M7PBM9_STRPU|nr:uncharacterized protein LOC105445817 [Strongylocentrotus purpuratus]